MTSRDDKPVALREAEAELAALDAKRNAAESKRQRGIELAQEIEQAEVGLDSMKTERHNIEGFIATAKERCARSSIQFT